jgi:hypothetical protein
MPDSNVEQQPQPRVGRGLGERLSDGRTVLAIFALALYAVLRVAYVRFYAPFGLTPDDLGLGYVELLAQSAIGAGALLSVVGLGLCIVGAISIGLLRLGQLSDAIRSKLPGKQGAVAEALFILSVLVGSVLILFWRSIGGYPPLVFGAYLLAVGGLGGARQVRRGLIGELSWRGKPATPWWRGGAIATLIASITLTGAALSETADREAKAVMAGYAVHPTLWGVRVTSWGAEPATLVWTTDKVDATQRQLSDSCLMYLGQSGGTLFVYAKSLPGPSTFRIPATMAVIQLVPDGRCVSGMRTPVRSSKP